MVYGIVLYGTVIYRKSIVCTKPQQCVDCVCIPYNVLYVSTMSADALSPCVPKSSAAMILTLWAPKTNKD